MKIQDVLQNAVTNDDLSPTSYFRGRITKDATAERFRLYPLPYNDSDYFIINCKDVAGDIYKLSKEELIDSGFAGVDVYKVPLLHGTKVAHVKIRSHRVGETVDSVSFNLKLPPGCNSVDCGGLGCCNSGPSGGACFCSACCDAAAVRTPRKATP